MMKKALLSGLGLLIGTTVVTANLLAQHKVEANVVFVAESPPTIASAFPSTKLEARSTDNSFLVAQASNLSGAWNCNDGGVYFIRQVGNELWWYGQSSGGGRAWSNVFHGVIRGDQIAGRWADVPKGRNREYGEMVLLISDANRLDRISGGQNFGGRVWSR